MFICMMRLYGYFSCNVFAIFPGGRRMSERDMTRVGADAKPPAAGPQLLNSKSVPALHHIGKYSWIWVGSEAYDKICDRQSCKQIEKRPQLDWPQQQRWQHQHGGGSRILSELERLPSAKSKPAEPRWQVSWKHLQNPHQVNCSGATTCNAFMFPQFHFPFVANSIHIVLSPVARSFISWPHRHNQLAVAAHRQRPTLWTVQRQPILVTAIITM